MPEHKRQEVVVQAREAGTGRQLPATELCAVVVKVLWTIPQVERSKRAEHALARAERGAQPVSDGWLSALRATIGWKRVKKEKEKV